MTASLTDDRDLDRDDDRPTDRRRVDRRDRRGRRPVGGVKRLVWTIVVILAVIGAALASYLTPIMSVRSIDVSGTQVLDPAQIIATSQIRMGTPLLQVPHPSPYDESYERAGWPIKRPLLCVMPLCLTTPNVVCTT